MVFVFKKMKRTLLTVQVLVKQEATWKINLTIYANTTDLCIMSGKPELNLMSILDAYTRARLQMSCWINQKSALVSVNSLLLNAHSLLKLSLFFHRYHLVFFFVCLGKVCWNCDCWQSSQMEEAAGVCPLNICLSLPATL